MTTAAQTFILIAWPTLRLNAKRVNPMVHAVVLMPGESSQKRSPFYSIPMMKLTTDDPIVPKPLPCPCVFSGVWEPDRDSSTEHRGREKTSKRLVRKTSRTPKRGQTLRTRFRSLRPRPPCTEAFLTAGRLSFLCHHESQCGKTDGLSEQVWAC